MSVIGNFKKVGPDLVGEIFTLDLTASTVRIVKEDHPSSEDAPTHRIFAGRAEIGAAWEKTSREQRDYLSVKLDDPTLKAPIFANLFEDPAGEFSLIWSRARAA